MDQQNPTLAKIPILDTGKFEQWQFQIQQYLQHEHYALWEVIEFEDSYEAPAKNPTTGLASDGTGKKKGMTVTLTADDMQKRKSDVKERTTLLLSLPNEHQLRFSKYKTAQELWAAILKTFGGNEATKKTKKNLLKQQYGNFKDHGIEITPVSPNYRVHKPFWNQTGKFEQWQFQIQQYLQHEHYALWEVIEFGDSYEAPAKNPTTGLASDGTGKKKGMTVTLTADEMQKRKSDVKERTTLLLSLPDEHQLRFRIKREFSNAKTPQHNDVAEKRNKTLIEAARTMLADAKLPVTFWAEAVNTACYVQNRVLVNKSHNKTPYELFNGYFVGYSMSNKAFRVFNKRTKRVEENLHVEFLENKAIEKGAGPNWLFDIDSLTKSMNYVPVVAGKNSTNLSGTKDAASQEVKKFVSSLRYIALPNWVHDALLESCSSEPQDDCSIDVPKSSGNSNPTATSTNPSADQMETLTVETLIPTVSSPVPTACFTDSQEPSSDTRLILKRVANQVDTPSMDNILTLTNRFEDIFGVTTNSDESNRVEADVSYKQTTITASPTPTLRIHKDHPKIQIIGPVDTPIQTRNKSKEVGEQNPSWVEAMQEELLQFKIQNVWTLVDCPKRVRPIGTKWVLKNKKDERGIVIRNKTKLLAQGHIQEERIDYDEVFAPVARIEAIRLFLAYASFMGFTVYQMDVKSAFLYGTIDEKVYVMQPLGFQDPEFSAKVYKVEKAMYGLHQAPRACAMGKLNFFLGLQVLQKEDVIFLSQDKYVGDILKKFGYSDVRSLNTPMDKENPWGKDGIGKYVDLHLYRSMIESLMYLTASRPDIMFVVCACARHQVTPKECHLQAVKRIFRYLKGHHKLGLWYPKESPFNLVSYSDSDYGGATQDRKSTTGGCQFLGRRLILWQCKKQTTVATSTTEAEYIAAASGCGQVLWIQNQLIDYGSLNKPFDAGRFQYLVFWSNTRIETTEEGTKILATVDGILRTVTESSLRRNLKLKDEGEGSGTPTEPHHTPSPEAQHASPTTHSSPTLPPVTTASIPTVTPSDTPSLRQYTRRARIAQSSALPHVADEPASPLRDVSQGEAYLTISSLDAKQDRANIAKTSTLPHESTSRSDLVSKFEAQEVEITMLKARVKLLEDGKGGGAERSGDDAPIKGRRLNQGEEAAKKGSNDTEEMINVLTSMDAATVLLSGVAEVPTGSGSITTAGPPTAEVPTGSDVVPTAGLIFATATVVTPYTRRKGKEKIIESKKPKKKKTQEQMDIQMARQMEEEMVREALRMNEQIARDAEIARIHAEEELLCKDKVKEMMQLVPVEEIYVEALQVKHPIIDWKHLDREDLNQLWDLVKESLNIRPASSDKEMKLWVELKRLYEPDVEDQLWTHTQNMMHAPIEWKLYDSCGVHHVTSKDNEIFMLIEKDYPLRKGLAIVMISYKLQVENYSQMAFPLPVMKFQLAEEVPTASEESSHYQKKRDAIAEKIALLLESSSNSGFLIREKMSRDVLTVGSTMRIPLLYLGEYSQLVERFMNYLEEQTDGEAMINSIKNGDQLLPRVTQVSIAKTSSTEQPLLKDKSMWSVQEKRIQKIDRLTRSLSIQGLLNDIYSLIDSNKTAKNLWDALARHMLGSEYGEQDRKAAVLKFYSKPTNNNLRTSSTSQSANKKQEFVKTDDKKVEKKDYAKKRDMSKVKCYDCKKEGHFAKDCKKLKVKDYEYYKTKMLLAKKDKDEQVLLAEDQA
nr:putative ribonuclease H-like domain-containing protein [Tanacetum cinerariifolium]